MKIKVVAYWDDNGESVDLYEVQENALVDGLFDSLESINEACKKHNIQISSGDFKE